MDTRHRLSGPPTTPEGIERHLGSGIIRGIGPKRAARIVAGCAGQRVIREIVLFLHTHGVAASRARLTARAGQALPWPLGWWAAAGNARPAQQPTPATG